MTVTACEVIFVAVLVLFDHGTDASYSVYSCLSSSHQFDRTTTLGPWQSLIPVKVEYVPGCLQ